MKKKIIAVVMAMAMMLSIGAVSASAKSIEYIKDGVAHVVTSYPDSGTEFAIAIASSNVYGDTRSFCIGTENAGRNASDSVVSTAKDGTYPIVIVIQ